MACEASRGLTDAWRSRCVVTAGLIAVALLIATPSGAQLPDPALPDPSMPPSTPPPISAHYLQYGVALTGETVLSAGEVCPTTANDLPCILSDGGGLTVRVGYRSRGPWYLGGAYEISRMDS